MGRLRRQVIVENKIDGRIAANKRRSKITDEQILEAVKTMTRQEIADLYGVHVENLARRMKNLGVHAVYAVPEKKKRADEWHWTQGCADFVERCQNGFFELVEFKGGRVRIRCKKCGAIVERSRSTIRKKNVACDGCKKHEEEKQAREEFVKTLAKIAEYQKEKICPVCGNETEEDRPIEIFWCDECKTPVIKEIKDSSKAKCNLCGNTMKYMATDMRPVFPEEILLLELLLEKKPGSLQKSSIWASNHRYFIDGKVTALHMADYYDMDVNKIVEG